jgi:hypothetical protein
VVASAGEPLGASYLRDPTSVEVVHTCRVEMELGLCLKVDVILLLFVRYYLSSSISTYLCTTCPCCVWCNRFLLGTLPPWDVGSIRRGCRPAYLRKSWQWPLGGSLDWDLGLHTASVREH